MKTLQVIIQSKLISSDAKQQRMSGGRRGAYYCYTRNINEIFHPRGRLTETVTGSSVGCSGLPCAETGKKYKLME